ncbi:MAG: nitroreductase family deazaflavin-dependent oxidoreductase [Enhydrobacter sp.]
MIDAKVPDGLPKWMLDHIDVYKKSGGKEGHMYTIQPGTPNAITVPALLLATKGRKSGEKYLFPLFYGETGNSYFVIASKGGAPDHPGWYKNMLVHPDVEIQVGEKTVKAKARTVPAGAERDKLWKQAVGFFPPYADYQKKVPDRLIPIVMLDPVH